ncbi:hypothetical protein [Klebsiella quasipneumoniae]|uniref:hypothetical protein n=1 Tax=Klebsiella quasipneumoniae TaxID=1463165 RepID=UPI00220A74A9|nr:hypothetical protein [Klebsiella quasipneumoniae]BDO01629.1 hypothetical protein KAM622c_12160 [Klebsiella quasipneumoniae subsp. quasipneumoniae]
MDYGEGFAMTGFYVALNEDNGAGDYGFSPEAVLRTLINASAEARKKWIMAKGLP